jgi:hypothetical protein
MLQLSSSPAACLISYRCMCNQQLNVADWSVDARVNGYSELLSTAGSCTAPGLSGWHHQDGVATVAL